MLLSHRHPFLYKLAVFYHQQKRKLVWMFDRRKYASTCDTRNPLPHNVKRHSSRLIKVLGDSDIALQYNKVHNIRLCLPYLDGLVIKPGETFSFCRLIGKPTARRGFKQGMQLSMGKAQSGTGGGICQIANMLHWLVLHSPLTVTQRSTHSFDPFPDNNRSIPFGVGCAIFHNYVDFCFVNETGFTFQLHLDVDVDEKNLNGQLTSDEMIDHTYKVFEKNHRFVEENCVIYRQNEIWRKVMRRLIGDHLHDEHIKTNHVRVMYVPDKIDRITPSNPSAKATK